MLKPLRKNVLVDMGPPALLSEIIEIPDFCQGVGMKGRIVAKGPKCLLPVQEGTEVLVQRVTDYCRVFDPRYSERIGLKPHWHVLAQEDKLVLEMA